MIYDMVAPGHRVVVHCGMTHVCWGYRGGGRLLAGEIRRLGQRAVECLEALGQSFLSPRGSCHLKISVGQRPLTS